MSLKTNAQKRGRTASYIHNVVGRDESNDYIAFLEEFITSKGYDVADLQRQTRARRKAVGLTHTIVYEVGTWPTELESVSWNDKQHVIVKKAASLLGGKIENDGVLCKSFQDVGVLTNTIRFTVQLLERNLVTNDFDTIRNQWDGNSLPFKEILAFNTHPSAMENVTNLDVDNGTFDITSSVWALTIRPLLTSGYGRKRPVLFKLVFTPTTEDEELNKLLTVETEPFRCISRPWQSVAIKKRLQKEVDHADAHSTTTCTTTDADTSGNVSDNNDTQ